jgi:hypothetical protein
MTNALTAGWIGAATTNVLHETLRRTASDAPRVDLLGMQALAKMLHGKGPKGDALYVATLAGDLVANSLYFSALGVAPRTHVVRYGLFAGLLAGLGAVALPAPLGLDTKTTSRTTMTKLLTIALYTAGGLAAATALRDPQRPSTS